MLGDVAEKAAALLDAVSSIEPSLHAYFACMYYAALRPAEARLLHEHDCSLPASSWGQLVLAGSYQDSGSSWTDSGEAGEVRGLKHRNEKETRPVPADPLLVAALRDHIEEFALGAGGLLFPTRIGRFGRPISPPFGKPVSMKTVYRVWAAAREKALTKQQLASPLAARPYDLRHACVSTWLEAGVPSARVAAWLDTASRSSTGCTSRAWMVVRTMRAGGSTCSGRQRRSDDRGSVGHMWGEQP